MNSLALFDFDGTLTVRDTFWAFNVFARGRGRVLRAILGAFGAGLIRFNFDRDFLKNRVLRSLWGGVSYDVYRGKALEFSKGVEGELNPVALRVFERHVERGDRVVVITASMKEWIEPWASGYGVEVIATTLERRNGVLTGYILGKNCRGAEKVARLLGVVSKDELERFDRVYAYGNSSGDREMLAFSDFPVYCWDRIPDIF